MSTIKKNLVSHWATSNKNFKGVVSSIYWSEHVKLTVKRVSRNRKERKLNIG